MPTYDYRCETCGPFSRMRRIAERDAPCTCPACGAAAQRTLGMPGVSLSSMARAGQQVNAHANAGHRHGAGCGCGSSTVRVDPPGSLKTKVGAWRGN